MIDATHKGPVVSEPETARMAKKHQEFKYLKGVLVNFLFKAAMGSKQNWPHTWVSEAS